MKKIKQGIVFLLTVALSLSVFVGCGNKGNNKEKGTSKSDLGYNPTDYVTLGDYKGLESYDITYSASDDEVEEHINETLEENADYIDITDRAAKNGDFVTFDYSCKVDGKNVEDCQSTDYEIQLGNGEFDATLEEQMVGAKTGAAITCKAEISEELSESNAGDTGEFTITLTKIQEEKIPELNDAYVKEHSEKSKTVAEYKEEMKQDVIDTKKEENTESLYGELVTKAVENCEFKENYPQELYDSCKESIDAGLKYNAEMFGMEVSDLLSYFYGMSEDDLPAEYLNETHTHLFVYAVAEKESLFLTDKQYQEHAQNLADEYEYGSVKELEESEGKEAILYEAVYQNVCEFLYENAKKKAISEEEYNAMNADAEEGDEDSDAEGMEFEDADDAELDVEGADDEGAITLDPEELDDADTDDATVNDEKNDAEITEESADAPKEEVQE